MRRARKRPAHWISKQGVHMYSARVYKPNSVERSNLSGTEIAFSLKRFSLITQGTTLHSSKDLAVSLPTKGARLCSHLLCPL
jgi:hypothetical protein